MLSLSFDGELVRQISFLPLAYRGLRVKRSGVIGSLFLVWMLAGEEVRAPALLYLDAGSGTTGWIQLMPGPAKEVAVGDDISGWGRVSEIADTHLVVRQRVSEAEQERLRSQGMASYEVLELRVPRAGLGGGPAVAVTR